MVEQESKLFWKEMYRGENDLYVKLLENVFYGSFFLGAVPRLDIDKSLPRLELLVIAPTQEDSMDHWTNASTHLESLIKAISFMGFEVSLDHSMFANEAKMDVLPSMIIRVHDTVKHWSAELMSRVQEYIGFYLSRYAQGKKIQGIKVRPFTKQELELLYAELRRERELRAGGGDESKNFMKPDKNQGLLPN